MARLFLDYVVGPDAITRVLIDQRKQESQSQREKDWSKDAILVTLKTEERPMNQKMWAASRNWEWQGNFSRIFQNLQKGHNPANTFSNSVRSISELTLWR